MRLRDPDPVTVHLQKLAVGVPSLEAFQERVRHRRETGVGMQVRTRSHPKRSAEIVEAGSLYWVVTGMLMVRQRVLAIEPDTYEDGTSCARIEVEPVLIPVSPRPVRPFQGWRYLDAIKAPPDLTQDEALGAEALPQELLRNLRALCLV